jgi:hypothetical protein
MNRMRWEAKITNQQSGKAGGCDNASLTFTHFKGRLAREMSEVADFHAPVFIAVDAIVLYFQSSVILPSWTSKLGSAERRMAGDGRFDFLRLHTSLTQVLTLETATQTKQ